MNNAVNAPFGAITDDRGDRRLDRSMIDPEDPFDSLESCMNGWAGDWSTDGRLAWVYGVVVGWSDAAMGELQAAHGWGPDEVARLRRLHTRHSWSC